MHKVLIFLFGLFLSANVVETHHSWTELTAPTHIEVYFSPRGGAQGAITRAINNAQKEILVMAYSFTSANIANALITAHKRGLTILIIMDKSQLTAHSSQLDKLALAYVPIFIDKTHAIAHNKVIIIDKKIVITGSYNFTKAAETRNAENLLLITNEELAKEYIINFNRHKAHATPFIMEHSLSKRSTATFNITGKSSIGVVQKAYPTKKDLHFYM